MKHYTVLKYNCYFRTILMLTARQAASWGSQLPRAPGNEEEHHDRVESKVAERELEPPLSLLRGLEVEWNATNQPYQRHGIGGG